MTGLDVDAIEARLSAATPGPWEFIDSEQGHPAGAEWEVYAPSVKNEDRTGWVCEQSEVHGEDGGIAYSGVGGRRDAEFIAHAPADIAALLAEVKTLRRACVTLGAIVDRQAVDICRIADVPMPESGDADFELAWSRASEMAAKLARVEALAASDWLESDGAWLQRWITPSLIRAVLAGEES